MDGGFDSRHGDHVQNTEVLLALLTQNKELEGESCIVTRFYSGHPFDMVSYVPFFTIPFFWFYYPIFDEKNEKIRLLKLKFHFFTCAQ